MKDDVAASPMSYKGGNWNKSRDGLGDLKRISFYVTNSVHFSHDLLTNI